MYGTIPIVHATGGLKDSVKSWYSEKESSTGALGAVRLVQRSKTMGCDDVTNIETT